MINAVEVVHTIAIGNIGLTTQQIHDRRVDLLQLLLWRHGHATHSLMGILLIEESAVADHQA